MYTESRTELLLHLKNFLAAKCFRVPLSLADLDIVQIKINLA